jgi:GNAT superfamily N-acetyltransferase
MTTRPRLLPVAEAAAANEIADHFDYVFRTILAPADALKTRTCFRFMTGEPHPFGNLAVFSRAASPAEVGRDAAPMRERNCPAAIVFLGEGTPAQIAPATALGFVPAEPMPLMSVTPDTLARTVLPDGYTYRQITMDDAAAWNQAFSVGYDLPPLVGSLIGIDRAATRAPGVTKYFAAEHKGRIVATSLVYFHDGLAGIYAVATIPEHRGRGLGAHLTAEPLRGAWELGHAAGLLQASQMGTPVYKRIGFRTRGHMTLLVCMPG